MSTWKETNRRRLTGAEHRHDRQEIKKFKACLEEIAKGASPAEAYAKTYGETIFEAKPEKPEGA